MEATKRLPRLGFALVLICGCKAQPQGQKDAAVFDLAPDDGGEADLSEGDGSGGGDFSCPMGAVEICGNGCDDDRNGYTDDDDPACTPQVMATWEVATPLQRLVLAPPYLASMLDVTSVPLAAHSVYSRAFSPGIAYLSVESFDQGLWRIHLGTGQVDTLKTTYQTHDVCIFHGELIVVERAGKLHRLQADAMTEIGVVQLPSWMPLNTMLLTACSSDGTTLYVAEHPMVGTSQFEILDDTYTPVASPSPIPNALVDIGIDRCLDFAWAKGRFYGLFVSSGGDPRDSFEPTELVSFALDGAVGDPIDAGLVHGIGEFLP